MIFFAEGKTRSKVSDFLVLGSIALSVFVLHQKLRRVPCLPILTKCPIGFLQSGHFLCCQPTRLCCITGIMCRPRLRCYSVTVQKQMQVVQQTKCTNQRDGGSGKTGAEMQFLSNPSFKCSYLSASSASSCYLLNKMGSKEGNFDDLFIHVFWPKIPQILQKAAVLLKDSNKCKY